MTEFRPTVSRSPLAVGTFDRWQFNEVSRDPLSSSLDREADRGDSSEGRPGIDGIGVSEEPGRPVSFAPFEISSEPGIGDEND